MTPALFILAVLTLLGVAWLVCVAVTALLVRRGGRR